MSKKKMYHYLFFSLLTIAVLGLSVSGCRKQPAPEEPAKESNTSSAGNAEVADGNGESHAEWVTDFEQAKQLAKAQGKDLLVDFSGSDWCGWCIKLDKEVFSQPVFIDEAQKNYIFVMIDFPRDKSGMSQALQDQNAQLAKQFEIKGYPTVLLMNADGVVYAQTGYQPDGPEAYLEHLKELRSKK